MNFRILILTIGLFCAQAWGMDRGSSSGDATKYHRLDIAKPLHSEPHNAEKYALPELVVSTLSSSISTEDLPSIFGKQEADKASGPTLQEYAKAKNKLKDQCEDGLFVGLSQKMASHDEKLRPVLPAMTFRKHQEGVGDALTVASKVAQGGLATAASFCWLSGNWVPGAVINGVNAKLIAKVTKGYGLAKQSLYSFCAYVASDMPTLLELSKGSCLWRNNPTDAITLMTLIQAPLSHIRKKA